MSKTPPKSIIYGVFLLSVVLTTVRDIGFEVFVKHSTPPIHPVFFLFISVLLTQVFCAAFLVRRQRSIPFSEFIRKPGAAVSLFYVNFFTFLSFLAYFLAIGSPIGAGFNSVVSFGSDPIFTVLVGLFFIRERIDRRFLWTCVISFAGIALLGSKGLTGGGETKAQSGYAWQWGVALSLASSFFFAIYIIYLKRLQTLGMSTLGIVLARLWFCCLASGLWLILRPGLFEPAAILEICVFSLITFCLPIVFFVYSVGFLTIRSLAVLLFLNPILTIVTSSVMGFTHLGWIDLIASALILFAVFFDEFGRRHYLKS